MVELVFAAATAVALFVLLSWLPWRPPTLRTWTTLVGILVIAVPGVISLVSLTAPLSGAEPFAPERTVLAAAATPESVTARNLADAPAVLVRAFLVVTGNEEAPVERYESVVPRGATGRFELADGSSLAFAITSRPGQDPSQRATRARTTIFRYRWRAPRRQRSGEVRIGADPRARDGDPIGIRRVRTGDLKLDFAWFGSLLDDAHRSVRVHFFLSPLADAAAVTSVAAPTWWERHGEQLIARIRDGQAARQSFSEGSGSSFDIGNVLSVSGLLVLLAGSLLVLVQSRHWVRTACFLFLYFALYVGAMDSLLLRIHTAALSVGPRDSRAAAAVEAAASRLHRVTAARALLDVAMTGEDRRVRRVAVRCLEYGPMWVTLPQVSGWQSKLESLATGPDPEVAAAAGRILNSRRKPEGEERRRRRGPRGSRRPVSPPASPDR